MLKSVFLGGGGSTSGGNPEKGMPLWPFRDR